MRDTIINCLEKIKVNILSFFIAIFLLFAALLFALLMGKEKLNQFTEVIEYMIPLIKEKIF